MDWRALVFTSMLVVFLSAAPFEGQNNIFQQDRLPRHEPNNQNVFYEVTIKPDMHSLSKNASVIDDAVTDKPAELLHATEFYFIFFAALTVFLLLIVFYLIGSRLCLELSIVKNRESIRRQLREDCARIKGNTGTNNQEVQIEQADQIGDLLVIQLATARPDCFGSEFGVEEYDINMNI